MHKQACKEMVEITTAVVAAGLPFTMWGNSYDGNIGINIKMGDKEVDICQYMSPSTKKNTVTSKPSLLRSVLSIARTANVNMMKRRMSMTPSRKSKNFSERR